MLRLDPGQVSEYVRNLPPYSGCKGSVVRLRVTDFMTYHFAEFRAGAHVNLILGPNGTGKSTIVCAICLGLAGKPKILGRALALKEYIRHGAKSATIEIELYNPNGLNFVIKRFIKEVSSGTASVWYLGGKKTNSGAIDHLTASLNIQLDNLCQFLPQDRVQDFVVMDSASLLQNTQKALGTDLLYNRHQKLIALTVAQQEVDKNLKACCNTLKTEQQYTKRVEGEVNSYRHRESLKAKIADMTCKKAWIKYIKSRDAFSTLKTQLETVTQKKKLEEAKLAPSRRAVDQLDAKKGRLWAELNRCRSKATTLINGVKRSVEEEFDKVEACVCEEQAKYTAQEKAETYRLKKIENVNVKIRSNESQLEEIRVKGDMDDEKLNADLAKHEAILKQYDDEILAITGLDEKDEANRRQIQNQIRNAETELLRMEDFAQARLSYLQREQPDVYDTVMYFRNPENLKHFKGNIHEPMVLHISVNDLRYGPVAERHIGFTELNGFFCENKDDVVKMLQLSEKRGKRVSVTHYQMRDDVFEKPRCRYSDEFKRRWGFSKVLMDLVEGPDYYLSYLSERFKLENILIGTSETERLFEDIINQTDLSLFYTQTSVYSMKKSHYCSSKVTSYNALPPARVMTREINAAEQHRLRELLGRLRSEAGKLESSINSRTTQKLKLEADRQSVEDQIADINARVGFRRNVEQRLELARKQLVALEKDKIDLESLKKATEKAILGHRLKLLSVMDFVSQRIAEAQQDGAKPIILRRQISLIEARLMSMQNDLDQMLGDVRQCEAQIKTLTPQVEAAANEAKAAKQDAIVKSNDKDEIPPDVLNGKMTEKEADKQLNQAAVELRFLVEGDPSVERKYREKMRQIAELNEKKEAGEKRLADLKEEIEREKEAWLNPLTELIGTVNRNFGRFFASMGCAGEVVLHKGTDEDDFSKYGIKILVKFRSSEPLSELGGNKGLTLQSGGERVISTALYILALQELTKVPFRVIDEINQGMDATNEARFFNLLCTLAQGPNTPQYFLLTPKMLPPNVQYPDNVCFHFIMSGPHVNVPLEGHHAIGAGSDDTSGEED